MPDFDHSVLGTREQISLGLDTFGDAPLDGAPGNHAETLREVVAEAVLADRVGVDYIGLGEHHRADYAVSAPDVVLAAIAGQTERIRLGTGVTVLSSDDPIRVYQRFATLDAVSGGRAEVQLGRGSFIESFSLFGLDLGDYDRLFAEKLDLFSALQHEQPVTWQGSIRAPLEGKQVYPTTAAGKLPAWIAVGGTPESVVRAAKHGMPLVLAVIGGSPAAFVQFSDLYRRALEQFGHAEMPIGMHSPGHVAATDDEAREQLYPTRPRSSPAWAASAAGRRTPGSSSSRRRRPRGRSSSARPRRSRRRSPGPRAPWVSPASSSSTPWARCRTPSASSRCGSTARKSSRGSASCWPAPRLAVMRTFIRRSLWDVVPRDQRDTPEAFRRRQVVAAIVVLVGAIVLGWSLRLEPGGNTFYVAAVLLAGIWAAGAFLSGRLHLGRISGGEVFIRPILAPILLGLLLVGVFVLGALVVREIDPLADYVSSVLAYADEGSLTVLAVITFFNGIAEELFFRGAMYAAIPRHPVLWTTLAYVVATLATGNVMLGFAAIVLGVVCGLERRASGGVLAPILTHITWSLSMLFLLPLLF